MVANAPPNPAIESPHVDLMLRELYRRADAAGEVLAPGTDAPQPPGERTFEVDRAVLVRRITVSVSQNSLWPWFTNISPLAGFDPPVPIVSLNQGARILDVQLSITVATTRNNPPVFSLVFALGFGSNIISGNLYRESTDVGFTDLDHLGEPVGDRAFVYKARSVNGLTLAVPDSRQRLFGNYALSAAFVIEAISIGFFATWTRQEGVMEVVVDYVDAADVVNISQETLGLQTVFVRP